MAGPSAAAPAVSVVMPVYNRVTMVRRAVDSILRQSFADFEFIIVDDGSDDGTLELIEERRDPRIRLLALPQNAGNAEARNTGIAAARGTYLAVMDSDDVAHPERLGRQVAAFEARPELTGCGSAAWRILRGKRQRIGTPPADDGTIKSRLLYVDFAFYHPSMMFRRSVFDSPQMRYSAAQPTSSDYDLLVSMIEHGDAVFANLPDVLIEYHIHSDSVVRSTPNHELHKSWIRRRLLGLYYPWMTGREAAVVAELSRPDADIAPSAACEAIDVLDRAETDGISRYGEDREVLAGIAQELRRIISTRLATGIAQAERIRHARA